MRHGAESSSPTDPRIFADVSPEPRFASWTVGEVHVSTTFAAGAAVASPAPWPTSRTQTATRGFESDNHTVGFAVPEPASWALMILGFGGVGAMMRRRTVRAVAA